MKTNYKPGRNLGILSVTLLFAIGISGIVLSSEQSGIGKSLTGDKTNANLEEKEILNKIKIKAGETMNEDKKKLIGKYLAHPEDKNKVTFYVAEGWGEQLRPPDALKRATINLAEAVRRYTNLNAKVDEHVFLDFKKIFEVPFVYISAENAFSLSKNERNNFGKYLRNGGFAFIDNGAPEQSSGDAASSLKKMLLDALGASAVLRPIPNDHVLYHCYFDFNDGPPMGKVGEITKKRFTDKGYLEGIWIGERLAVVYFDFGYGYRWIEPEKSDPQIKMGVNLVVFALLQENGIMTGHTEKP